MAERLSSGSWGQWITPEIVCSSARVASRLLTIIFFVVALIACEADEKTIADPQYAAALVGTWQGNIDNESETISFRANGDFTAESRSMGFISNTLSQSIVGELGGSWQIEGRVITLTIERAKNEHYLNSVMVSSIVEFQQDKLMVKSVNGNISTFYRTR